METMVSKLAGYLIFILFPVSEFLKLRFAFTDNAVVLKIANRV